MRDAAHGISVVCVYNDPDVRRECLDRSLTNAAPDIDVDLIPVDNTTHAFSSAGAALNYGVGLARYPVVVLVHQDVYLHSVRRLIEVGVAFEDPSWGLLGANGVTRQGESIGRLRDRVQLIGTAAPTPVEVDSLDEVLILAPRRLLLEHPLSEDPDLAWHAYAVEYGLRLRTLGFRVGAVDCAITHNSLTVNLARLDVAHRRVAELYPTLSPVHTTCGLAGVTRPRWRSSRFVREHGWRLRWLKLSMHSQRLRKRLPVPVVLSDIRHDVDLLLPGEAEPLVLINADGREGGFARVAGGAVLLTRNGRPVVMQAVDTALEAEALLREVGTGSPVLVVGVGKGDLEQLIKASPTSRPWVLGLQPGAAWLIGGPLARELPEKWNNRRSLPLGQRWVSVSAGPDVRDSLGA